jgi:hypothetical protein
MDQTLTLVDPETGRTLKLWNGRKTMRTLADALAKLHELGSLRPDGQVEIRTRPMPLPNGERTAVVMVIGAQDKFGWGIAMPSAAKFRAMDTLGRPHRYETSALNGAIADAHGNVDLPDGSYIHSVELEPTKLNYELPPVQKTVLHHTIPYLKAEDACYRYVDNQLLPGLRALDFDAVAKLKVGRRQSLIARYVTKTIPVSRSTIASALANSGLLRPRAGQRPT